MQIRTAQAEDADEACRVIRRSIRDSVTPTAMAMR
jgi:hypothetical protein